MNKFVESGSITEPLSSYIRHISLTSDTRRGKMGFYTTYSSTYHSTKKAKYVIRKLKTTNTNWIALCLISIRGSTIHLQFREVTLV